MASLGVMPIGQYANIVKNQDSGTLLGKEKSLKMVDALMYTIYIKHITRVFTQL
jgi:hypothetical protein